MGTNNARIAGLLQRCMHGILSDADLYAEARR